MKNKLELYIVSGLIILLSLYIIFRDNKNLNYDIPRLEKFNKEDITKIQFKDMALKKVDGLWFLPSGYEALESKVERLLSDATAIELIDMISDSKDYSRFQLDSPDVLAIFKNDERLLELLVGGSSSTGNYTYVKLPGRDEIYSVRGSIDNTFNKSELDLRNKTVFTVNSEKVKEIKITKDSETLSKTGEALVPVTDLIKSVEATSFDDLDRSNEILNIEVIGDTIKTLTIFEKVDNEYPALSSEVSYPFTLPSWSVDRLLEIE